MQRFPARAGQQHFRGLNRLEYQHGTRLARSGAMQSGSQVGGGRFLRYTISLVAHAMPKQRFLLCTRLSIREKPRDIRALPIRSRSRSCRMRFNHGPGVCLSCSPFDENLGSAARPFHHLMKSMPRRLKRGGRTRGYRFDMTGNARAAAFPARPKPCAGTSCLASLPHNP